MPLPVSGESRLVEGQDCINIERGNHTLKACQSGPRTSMNSG